MELSVLRAQASSLAHFLFKPGVSMSKRCLFIFFCLFICITQCVYAEEKRCIPGKSIFNCPIDNLLQTSGFQPNRDGSTRPHLATDCISKPETTDRTVKPIYDGEVIEIHSENDNCAGRYVKIKHLINDTEIYSLYQHLEDIYVGLGPVTKDTSIGKYGSTGSDIGSCGHWDPHLHFIIFTGYNSSESPWPPGDLKLQEEYKDKVDVEFHGPISWNWGGNNITT